MPGVFANTAWGIGPTTSVAINVASSGNNTQVAAQAGKRIVVILGDLVAAGNVTVTFQASGGAVLDGPYAVLANGGKIFSDTDRGHFSTPVGEGLVINLSGNIQVGGHLVYALV